MSVVWGICVIGRQLLVLISYVFLFQVSQSVVNINVDLFIIAMKAVRDSCTGATRVSLVMPA